MNTGNKAEIMPDNFGYYISLELTLDLKIPTSKTERDQTLVPHTQQKINSAANQERF